MYKVLLYHQTHSNQESHLHRHNLVDYSPGLPHHLEILADEYRWKGQGHHLLGCCYDSSYRQSPRTKYELTTSKIAEVLSLRRLREGSRSTSDSESSIGSRF